MSRFQLVTRVHEAGRTHQQAADGSGVRRRTVAKWVQRFRAGGACGVEEGSSRLVAAGFSASLQKIGVTATDRRQAAGGRRCRSVASVERALVQLVSSA
jgi:hypothetical protein